MKPFQLLAFRLVLNATGCFAAAKRAAQTASPCAKLRRVGGHSNRQNSTALLPRLKERPPLRELDDAIAALETEAVRRALSGVSVPVFHQGRECGNTVKHSDQLLMFLLKTLRPERYAAGKEPVQPLERRMVTLDVDLSAAQEEIEQEEIEQRD